MIRLIVQNDLALLLRLIVAHLIVDFIFQTRSLVEHRFKKKWVSRWLYVHGALAGIFAYILTGAWDVIWLPFVIFISHIVCDGLKSRGEDTARSFLLDQLAHMIVILGCWVLLIQGNISEIVKALSSEISKVKIWVLVLSYIVVIWPAGIWIGKVTKPWRKEIEGPSSQGLEKAGLWIGRLERILILTFVLLKHYEVIGFLVAAKSIFRFGEIKDPNRRKETEYILIGTMISFSIAIFLGIFAHWILHVSALGK